MKKILLITLCVLSMFGTLRAQENEVIIDGTVGSYTKDMMIRYAPIFTSCMYSVSQQYYLAEEIGKTEGWITKIALQTDMTWYETDARTIDVFLVNTENGSFNKQERKFEQLTEEDIYFSGEVAFTPSSWVEIELTKGFLYTGDNILVCINDMTGVAEYQDSYFAGFEIPDTEAPRCAYNRNEGGDYVFDVISKAETVNEYSYQIPNIKFVFNDSYSIEENIASFNVYPNPVKDELFIATEVQVKEVAIYDIYGRQAMRQQVNEATSQQVVNVADLETGVYFVNIKTDNGNIVKRFVKN